MADAVRAAGGDYAVVLNPSELRVLGPLCAWPEASDLASHEDWTVPVEPAVERWSSDHAIPFLSLAPALSRAAAEQGSPWFPGDTRWNARGHAVAAAALTAWSVVGGRRRGN